jgi:hypothetical protein
VRRAPGLEEERDRLAREHGPWRDRIELAPGIFTTDSTSGGPKGRSILQATADVVGDLDRASVIDLGAAEGLFSIEFARHAAEVVAVEGRIGNVEKARFAARALGLSNLDVVHDDHLEGDAAVKLCHDLAKIARRVAVIDTHVAARPTQELEANGRTYSGRPVREFDPRASTDEQERLSRSGIGNPEAFWLTRSSLFNLLEDAGFTSVFELRIPHLPTWNDRVILVCLRGTPRRLKTIVGDRTARWTEREDHGPHPSATWQAEIKRRLAPYVPVAVKDRARRGR